MRKTAKKAFLILLLVLAVCSFFAALTPQLLRLEGIRAGIADQLQSALEGEVTVGTLRWRWLPLPHLEANDARIQNDQLDLTIPVALLYPDWPALFFGGRIEPGTLVLKRPRLHLKESFVPTLPDDNNLADVLPRLTLVVRDGEVTTSAMAIPDRQAHLPPLEFTVPKATLTLTARRIGIKLHASAKRLKDFYLDGWFEPATHRYDFVSDCQGLALHSDRGAALNNGNIVPLDSVVNLSGGIKGTGLAEFSGRLVGDLPCLLYEPQGRKVAISCGYGDVAISKKDNRLRLAVNKLELKNPGFTLHGEVSRATAPADPAAPPVWHIDLAATDLDLTAIRSTLLTLLPKDQITAEVCDIVRSGRARSGSFRFDGPLADLEEISKMTITADVIQAAIHVPYADLDLSNASGPIRIANGDITGSGLSAKLGNSVGNNGSFLVGLAQDNFGFQLDLDIDADLADLPPVLAKEVHHEGFQQELARFSGVRGRARGHLHLGDNLNKIAVGVRVDAIDGTFTYNRLPWPVAVQGGGLDIDADHFVRWHGIRATVGPQRIQDSAGSVTWAEGDGKEKAFLTVDKLAARLMSHPIYAALASYPKVKALITPVLGDIDGPITIKPDSRLTGPFLSPETWQYRLLLHADGVTWRSPLLPTAVTTASADGVLTDTGFELSNSRNIFLGKLLALRGTFQHHLLHQWSGTALFSGTVGHDATDWLKSKGWVPPSLLPRTPATLDELRLTWGPTSTTVDGTIIAGAGGRKAPRLHLKARSTGTDPLALQVDFLGRAEQGHLSLDLLDNTPESFTFRWQGSLSAETADALLVERDLLTGEVTGDFTITVPNKTAKARTTGRLRVDRLRWFWGLKTAYLTINTMQLHGKGDQVDINALKINFENGESLSLTGTLRSAKQGLKMDGALTSPSISQHTVDNFLGDLDSLKKLLTGPRHKAGGGWTLTGGLDFDLAQYVSNGKGADGTPPGHIFTWSPTRGHLTLLPGGQTAIDITTAKLCCLEAKGVWYSAPTLGDSHFTVASACAPLPRFQEVLPCLGINQDVVEGDFTFDADLHGLPGHWRRGKVAVRSDNGRILRMTLLSKIFSVVNLTDLFATYKAADMEKKGFPYSLLDLQADIKDNQLVIRKAVIKGEGLNLFARGKLDLATYDADLTVLIAPFKTLDAIISMVPIIGRAIGGKNGTLITIPVGVKGPIKNPTVTLLPPSAIGEGLLNVVKDTLLLPFNILSPILPGNGGKTDNSDGGK